MAEQSETYHDQICNFSITERDARGRLVRLNRSVGDVLAKHRYPEPIKHLLAEALALAALMGSLQKELGSQFTMQAQTNSGPVRLLVVDFKAGELRGYADFDRDKVSNVGANPSLSRLFGDGFLAITFETGSGQRYQGVVPLEGDSLSQACELYFSQSEQIPTIVRLGSYITADNCFVGGLLVQYLPKGEVGRDRLHARMEHPDWNHISVLSGSMSHAELIDPTLSMEALVWRLFHEEEKVLTEKGHELKKGCRCTKKHYERIISQFPSSEKDQMRNENGKIVVDCSFCSKQFLLGL